MNYSKVYQKRKFEIGEIARAFMNVFERYSYSEEDIVITVSFNIGEISGTKRINFDELDLITDINKENPSIFCHTNYLAKKEHFETISFHDYDDGINLRIESEHSKVLQEINDIIVSSLSLTILDNTIQRKKAKSNVLSEERIGQLVDNKDKLSSFISTRFGEKCELYVPKVERSLSLLDINVYTGREYQPRRISEKVLEMLENNIDFLVYLITSESESFWTRDELVTAKSRNAHIIVLLEKGATFNDGIFGDIEYIKFDINYIETSFIKLLEGINYIKKKKFNIA